jgi:hypothetical protein
LGRIHILSVSDHLNRLTDRYNFKKPNDRRALDLMNAAAVEVMKDLPDLCIAYGISDEYRSVSLVPHFALDETDFSQLRVPSKLPII